MSSKIINLNSIRHKDESPNFISEYLDYASNTEVPAFFHRWSAIASIGALLGRQYYLRHGHFNIYPNMYCMLMGAAGTRKSTAIKLMKHLLVSAGYDTIAANKTTKEKFMLDLAKTDPTDVESILDQNLFGGDDNAVQGDAEMFIMADEFNDFFGNNSLEFVSFLGTLWDWDGPYKNSIKNGKSVIINNPTISILGGTTPTTFSNTFPTEIFGQGFFSRILLIYGEPNGKRITFPEPANPEHTAELVNYLQTLKLSVVGDAELEPAARKLIEKIYCRPVRLSDARFDSYYNRRLNHLLKLCLIISASRLSTKITDFDVLKANTILTHTEQLMPKALGEFGKGKNSDVSHKVIQVLENTYVPLTLKDIWKEVHTDLEDLKQLVTILQNLQTADKIQSIPEQGFLAKKTVLEEIDNSMVDYSLLTEEERNMSK